RGGCGPLVRPAFTANRPPVPAGLPGLGSSHVSGRPRRGAETAWTTEHGASRTLPRAAWAGGGSIWESFRTNGSVAPEVTWQTGSCGAGDGGQCVAVAATAATVHVRGSKRPGGPVLTVPSAGRGAVHPPHRPALTLSPASGAGRRTGPSPRPCGP